MCKEFLKKFQRKILKQFLKKCEIISKNNFKTISKYKFNKNSKKSLKNISKQKFLKKNLNEFP